MRVVDDGPVMRAFFVALFLFLTVSVSQRAMAECSGETYSSAMAKCQAFVATAPLLACSVKPDPLGQFGGIVVAAFKSNGQLVQSWGFCGIVPPSNPCTDNAMNYTGLFPGKITNASSWCKGNVPTGDGGTTFCAQSFVPSGPPTQNQWGSWSTPGTLSASGSGCDAKGKSNEWTGPDGKPMQPAPPSPDVTPPKNPMPKTCGGGSCYDPATDTYTAVDANGNQISVPGSAARGSSGSCISSGDTTLCAGSPGAPKPPGDKVPDPSTAIRNSDNYTQADQNTGANQNVTVNTYTNQGGQGSTSGQKPGDSGPASSSSSPNPDKGNSASGGGDCGSPPVMGGDAALAMIARQQWLTRCGPDKSDKNGNGQPDWTEVSDSDGDQYNVTPVKPSDVFKNETADVSSVDQTSWAGNTCPDLGSAEVFGTSWTPDTTLFCRYLAYIRAAVLLAGAIVSVLILAGGAKE